MWRIRLQGGEKFRIQLPKQVERIFPNRGLKTLERTPLTPTNPARKRCWVSKKGGKRGQRGQRRRRWSRKLGKARAQVSCIINYSKLRTNTRETERIWIKWNTPIASNNPNRLSLGLKKCFSANCYPRLSSSGCLSTPKWYPLQSKSTWLAQLAGLIKTRRIALLSTLWRSGIVRKM